MPSLVADKKIAESPRLSPPIVDRPIKVAILGTGFIADYHLEILRELPDVEVLAACDPNAVRRQAFCRQWGIPHQASSLDQLVDNVQPDVVHVLVPPPLHFDVTKEALQAGVHVLLEKPMALSGSEATELAELASSQSLHLGVNHNWRYQPLFQRLLDDIQRRSIGPVRHVISSNSLPLFQLDAGQHDHWMFAEPTNVLFEQGPHPLSQICWLLGDVEEVDVSWTDRRTLRGGKPFYSTWLFNLKCQRGTAQMSLSFGQSFPDARLHVIGQDGAIHLDQLNHLYGCDRRTRLVDPGDRFARGMRQAGSVMRSAAREFAGYGLSLFRIVGRQDAYYLGMRRSLADFYQSLAAGQDTARSTKNGLQTIRALEGAANLYATTEAAGQAASDYVQIPAVPTQQGKVLVIGGSGFIGRKLVQRLAQDGYPIRLLVRSPRRVADLASQYQLDIVAGDVEQPGDVDRAVHGCDTVVHLVAGAETWEGFQRLFVDGLQNVADASLKHGVKKLIYASSITALYLGDANQVVTEALPVDQHPEKRCDYAKAKILSENLLAKMNREQGLPAVIMRPGIVIGEGSAVQHLGVGEWPSPITCVRWGTDVNLALPFVLVDDVADAFARALQCPEAKVVGKAFNLVGDAQVSAREYVDVLRKESQRDFRLHPQSVTRWALLEWSKWFVKFVARKPENSRLTRRELAYRTAASRFDCRETKRSLDWQPEASREAFVQRGIRIPLRGDADD